MPIRNARSLDWPHARRALGGVPVVEDATEDAWKTAQRLAGGYGPVIIDTPGFRSQATLACIGMTDFVLVPVKPSPFDVDRMLDTLNILINGVSGRRPIFRCVLTQTTRDSVIAKHIRTELVEAGYPVLKSEMTNRVIYPEAALWGATPSLVERAGAGARDIAAIAEEVDSILDVRRAAVSMNKKNLPRAIRQTADDMREAAAAAGAIDWRQILPRQSDATEPADRIAATPGSASEDNVIVMAPKSDASSAREEGVSPVLTPRSGEVDMARRRSLARAIVERHANYSAVGGVIPLPLVNIASITAIIVRMVKMLSHLYGVPFQRDRARAIVIGLIGGVMPTGLSTVATSTLIYIVPGSNLIGLAVSSIAASACTRNIGRMFTEHFESGATLADFPVINRR